MCFRRSGQGAGGQFVAGRLSKKPVWTCNDRESATWLEAFGGSGNRLGESTELAEAQG